MIFKKIGVGTLILTMLLVSIAFMPAASAEKLTERTNTAVENIEYLVLEEEPIITLNTPIHTYWYLLEADNQEQKILFSYIDNCYVSDEEKKEMKKAMKDIWSRYPDQITEEDNLTLEKIDIATAKYLNEKYGNDGIEIKWAGANHKSIIGTACVKAGVSSTYANHAKNYADDPDGWDTGFWQSYNHYYDPVLHTGYAPANCDGFADSAKTNFNNGAYYTAYENLGYASHYMSDLGNPMHTGLGSLQYLHQELHTNYESYVYNQWDTGYKYNDTVKNTNSFYTVTDPEQAAKNLASLSRSDLVTLYNELYYHPTDFGLQPEVIDITRRVLAETTKYNIGLVKYVKG